MRAAGLPHPDDLAIRFRHSREELAQRALASLIVGREPAKWNRPEMPTPRGLAFLRALDPYGEVSHSDVEFVDEFELPARHEAEKAGWPDYAVVHAGRLLLIELKTEPGSHRARQREHYLDLGRHHHPADQVDLLYVTPPMTLTVPGDMPARTRYAHSTWEPIGELVAEVWKDTSDDLEAALVEFTVGYLRSLDRPTRRPSPPRSSTAPPPSSSPARPPDGQLAAALDLARQVEQDRRQRGIPTDVVDAGDLEDFRLQLRDRLAEQAPHVKVWLWRAATSGGRPLTSLGEDSGYELRLSYYA